MTLRLGLASSALVAAITILLKPPGAWAADAAHPEVIELFQSQGCSSCPPANAAVMALARDRPDLLMLSWQVTYWDDLGWKDTFGSPAFTARQHEYADAWNRPNVFTPEVVINGRADLVGSDPDELAAAVRTHDRGDDGPEVVLKHETVLVPGGEVGHGKVATVLLVRFDPRVIDVPIGRGENGGRTLPHQDVVRELVVLGSWSPGSRMRYALPPAARPGLTDAILVQQGSGGPIVAAARGAPT